MPGRPEAQLVALQAELDPDGSHGTQKIWAALKSLGLDPEDVDASFAEKGPGVHPKVPKESASDILQQRREIRTGLRQSRVQQVREALQALTEDDVRRFERCGDGVRPLVDGDLPPLDSMEGMADIREMQQRQMEKVEKDQERKANAICTDFLMAKKRAEEAEAKIEALERRLQEYNKEQQAHWKTKRNELQKQEEKRQAGAGKAAQERTEYEDTLEERANEKLRNARARRAQRYSTENLQAKLDKSNAKREAAFNAAVELEESTLASIAARQQAVEERLFQRRQEVAEEMEQRRQASQAMYLQKQVSVQAMQQEWAEKKLSSHKDYTTKLDESRVRGKEHLNGRSKSLSDLTRKATDKWRSNYDKVLQSKSTCNEELMARLATASHRFEHELKPMKLKCGVDVFSHLETKEKTFGDLQARRWAELKRSQDAHMQTLCIKIAEAQAKAAAKDASAAEIRRKRTEAAREILRYSNHAADVFLKIQSEPNETKIRAAMEGLGFKMPKLPDEEEEPMAAS